jgi:hypothetical protein
MSDVTKTFILFSLVLIGIIVCMLTAPVMMYYKTVEAQQQIQEFPTPETMGNGFVSEQGLRQMLKDQQQHDNVMVSEVRNVAIAGYLSSTINQLTGVIVYLGLPAIGLIIFLKVIGRKRM